MKKRKRFSLGAGPRDGGPAIRMPHEEAGISCGPPGARQMLIPSIPEAEVLGHKPGRSCGASYWPGDTPSVPSYGLSSVGRGDPGTPIRAGSTL